MSWGRVPVVFEEFAIYCCANIHTPITVLFCEPLALSATGHFHYQFIQRRYFVAVQQFGVMLEQVVRDTLRL